MTRPGLNIILIVLDTLGAKHMSLYGYHRRTTPNLERLAGEATVFSRCFATGCWTIPSHGSLFTGLYPSEHGAYEGRYLLHDNIHHLVPSLKMMGYRTLGISSNNLVAPASGLCPGFDYFKDYGAGFLKLFQGGGFAPLSPEDDLSAILAAADNPRGKWRLLARYLRATGNWDKVCKRLFEKVKNRSREKLDNFFGLSPIAHSAKYSEKTEKLFKQIIQEHDHHSSQPFFLFINFLEAHHYYRPPLRFRQFSQRHDRQTQNICDFYGHDNSPASKDVINTYKNLYDDEIYYLDDIIGRLYHVLKKSSIFDHTALIITSDHGEHFGEKGYYGHMLSLHNELIWIPLVIRFPRTLAPPQIDDRLVSLSDVFSTVLDLGHSPLPRPESSQSVLSSGKRELAVAQIVYPEIWAGAGKIMGAAYAPPEFAVMTGRGKKIIKSRGGGLQVYDLHEDPDEKHDLFPGLPGAAAGDYRALVGLLQEATHYGEAVQGARRRQELQQMRACPVF